MFSRPNLDISCWSHWKKKFPFLTLSLELWNFLLWFACSPTFYTCPQIIVINAKCVFCVEKIEFEENRNRYDLTRSRHKDRGLNCLTNTSHNTKSAHEDQAKNLPLSPFPSLQDCEKSLFLRVTMVSCLMHKRDRQTRTEEDDFLKCGFSSCQSGCTPHDHRWSQHRAENPLTPHAMTDFQITKVPLYISLPFMWNERLYFFVSKSITDSHKSSSHQDFFSSKDR